MSENALAAVKLPVDTFRDAAPHLRRPFTVAAVKWKVQAGTLVAPYIDSRLVTERLNLVVPHLWSDEYEAVAGGKDLLCRLTLDGITRIDTGGGYRMLKGNYSDAFKRAAVKFGVGVSLYALPKIFLSKDKGHLKEKKSAKGKTTLVLTDSGTAALQKGYENWLTATGEPMFGPVLDHGDVDGAIGDPDADAEPTAPESDAPAQPEPLTDAKAQALTKAAEDLYAGLSKEQAKGLTPAAFKRSLAGAAHSYDELEKLVADLEKRSA